MLSIHSWRATAAVGLGTGRLARWPGEGDYDLMSRPLYKLLRALPSPGPYLGASRYLSRHCRTRPLVVVLHSNEIKQIFTSISVVEENPPWRVTEYKFCESKMNSQKNPVTEGKVQEAICGQENSKGHSKKSRNRISSINECKRVVTGSGVATEAQTTESDDTNKSTPGEHWKEINESAGNARDKNRPLTNGSETCERPSVLRQIFTSLRLSWLTPLQRR
ncbi:hypothetical protein J6590_021389 [Homalodisca vitripennis]|nr:hypothetical protein J6590_021389 [Homalodisca vitripennis]